MAARVEKGVYLLQDRKVRLEMTDDIELGNAAGSAPKQIYYIGGDNGLGKTSFLEKVLIPALRQDQMRYLYLGQDLGLQLYTLRASLAVSGIGLANVDDARLIALWIGQGHGAQAFLLDEFDKYYPDYRFVFQESADFVRTYVLVSHVGHFQPSSNEFTTYQVAFELMGWEEETKRVRVSKTRL